MNIVSIIWGGTATKTKQSFLKAPEEQVSVLNMIL